MTRFAIDAPTALRLVHDDLAPGGSHSLVGAASLRSDVLALLYRQHRAGDVAAGEVRVLQDRLSGLKMRLLGDRVSRSEAWRIAELLDLDDPRPVEAVAVARLQADVLVTEDPELRRIARGHVDVVRWDVLRSALA